MDKAITGTINWRSIEIDTSCRLDYPIDGYCHIEIKCRERLPITETGYRSHFIQMAELDDYEGHIAYVIAWLDHAAHSQVWRQYVESRRQGDLFDI